MRKLFGGKKSKVSTYVMSPHTKRWHRVDPTDGRQTACGITINTATWSWPAENKQFPTKEELRDLCRMPECRGVEVPDGITDSGRTF